MREIKFRVWDKEECKMYYSKDIKVIFQEEIDALEAAIKTLKNKEEKI